MLDQDYRKKALELIAKFNELQLEKIKSFRDALKLIPTVIRVVETEYWGVAEADKKELAVAIANELVDLPYLPESAEAAIFGAAIDVAVDTLNRFFGQNWYERIPAR